MILIDGTDTRDEVNNGHGKYADGMSVYLEALWMNGDHGDYYGNADMGESAVVYGRRILWTTGHGFIASERYASESEATQVASDAYPWDDDDDDEPSDGFLPLGTGGLRDELAYAESFGDDDE
jgi:hypothetical protein